jgi:hypothetical protein
MRQLLAVLPLAVSGESEALAETASRICPDTRAKFVWNSIAGKQYPRYEEVCCLSIGALEPLHFQGGCTATE